MIGNSKAQEIRSAIHALKRDAEEHGAAKATATVDKFYKALNESIAEGYRELEWEVGVPEELNAYGPEYLHGYISIVERDLDGLTFDFDADDGTISVIW